MWKHRISAARRPGLQTRSIVITGLALTVLASTAAADAPDCTTVSYSGAGTSSNPYRIATLDQLQCIGADRNDDGDVADELDDAYALTSDIDASGTATWNGGNGFEPIGEGLNGEFHGLFDGNGHTISGLTVNRSQETYVGLFDYVGRDGVVRRVGLEGGSVTGDVSVGALAGYNRGTVEDSYATVDVSGQRAVGGLIGWNTSPDFDEFATVRRSFATGTVELIAGDGPHRAAGGLVGYNYGTIEDSYAIGRVDGGAYNTVGGLVGENNGVLAEIIHSYATGTVSGSSDVGGLVGDGGINNATTEGSYWDSATASGSDAGTELTTSEMQGANARTNMDPFDFSSPNTWAAVTTGGDAAADGYPILNGLDRKLQLEAQGIYTLGVSSITRSTPASQRTNADSVDFEVAFPESVQNVSTADFDVNGGASGSVDAVSGASGSTFTVTVGGVSGDGTLGLDLAAGGDIQDGDGNALATSEPGTDETFTIDNTRPAFDGGSAKFTALDENTTGLVTDADANDGDGVDTRITYVITGVDAAPFSIDATSGQVSSDVALDHENPNDSDGDGTYELEITATDDAGNSRVQNLSVTILDVNEPLSIVNNPSSSVVEGITYDYTPAVDDPDDGDTTTFGITNQPSWASFEPDTGALTGTPSNADVGSYADIEITVTDSGGFADTVGPFSITVSSDLDGDGIADGNDNDVDGDGIPGDVEAQYGLDDRDPSDALGDLDGDGKTNLEEYQAGTDLGVDTVAPVVTAPADIAMDAKGLFTEVDLGEGRANDALDGDVPINGPDPNPARLRPGRHEFAWSATDAAGNTGEVTQVVEIRPIVSLGKDRTVSEGRSLALEVYLNGQAPAYPVTVPYTVSGSATRPDDHDLAAGTVTIDAGRTASRPFTVVDDGVGGEGPEDLLVKLGEPVGGVASERRRQRITVVERNVAPQVRLTARQDGLARTTVVRGNGTVTLEAESRDETAAGDMSYDWSATDNRIDTMGAAGATLMVDPAPLNAGVYEVVVTVTDDGEPRETAAARLRLRVVASLPALGAEDTDADGASDASEGYGDSDLDGLADYRDASVPANALPAQGPDAGGALVEADAGLSLRLGPTAFAAEQPGAIVSEEMIAQFAPGGRKDDLPNVGGYFSFTVSGLPNGGDSARIVVPQRDAIPERPVYRKLSAVAGWRDFVTDAGNRLASAPGGSGLCPPPADPAYQPGLTPGHWCVRLTVEDGGPNDSDGRADTLITDPGGVGQDSASNTVAGNGGGGSLGWLMLALLGWFGCAGACSGYPRPGERVGPELVRG